MGLQDIKALVLFIFLSVSRVDSLDMFKCGSGVVIAFPTEAVYAAKKACAGEEPNPDRACYIVCINKQLGYFGEDNKFNIPAYRQTHLSFPAELQSIVAEEFRSCENLTDFPKVFDSTCSEFRNFETCCLDVFKKMGGFCGFSPGLDEMFRRWVGFTGESYSGCYFRETMQQLLQW